eukprot:1847486-Pleurochrysis_carterae.AAC.1
MQSTANSARGQCVRACFVIHTSSVNRARFVNRACFVDPARFVAYVCVVNIARALVLRQAYSAALLLEHGRSPGELFKYTKAARGSSIGDSPQKQTPNGNAAGARGRTPG